MAVEIKVPAVGESITEGTIGRWLKPNGAAVKANEPVLELETDKATQEIVAPSSGLPTNSAICCISATQRYAFGRISGMARSMRARKFG